MSAVLEKFDYFLSSTGPAAVVIREPLIPVEGADGVLFPATFAGEGSSPGGYNIDPGPDGGNIALVDSVGSQANRIEPLFAEPEYASLVPQVTIEAGNRKVSLLEAGHRAGDAIVRCSALQDDLNRAFGKLLDGDATELAKIAPTSLVFGVWDSRDTQAKMPRLISSTIRAYGVCELKRSAQYIPAVDYVREKLLVEPDKTTKDDYAKRGFIHVPATGSHGGIIAKGGVRRDATLAIAALKLIHAGSDIEATKKLRRYILGLALVAFTKLPGGYLRQGTILVSDPEKPRSADEVYANGERKPFTIGHEEALVYAREAAKDFGVINNIKATADEGGKVAGIKKHVKEEKGKEPIAIIEVVFDVEKAKKDLEGKEKKAKATKEKAKKES